MVLCATSTAGELLDYLQAQNHRQCPRFLGRGDDAMSTAASDVQPVSLFARWEQLALVCHACGVTLAADHENDARERSKARAKQRHGSRFGGCRCRSRPIQTEKAVRGPRSGAVTSGGVGLVIAESDQAVGSHQVVGVRAYRSRKVIDMQREF